MSIPLGDRMMTVTGHGIYEADNEKRTEYVGIGFKDNDSGEDCKVMVYITDKSAGMARKALKKLGFFIDKESILKLNQDRSYLKGRECLVKVFEDDYGGRVRTKFEIVLEDDLLAEAKVSKLDAMLRAAKKEDAIEGEAKAEKKPRGKSAISKAVEEHRADVEAHADDAEKF